MASIKISELEEVTKLSTSDVLPIINENKTKKVSLEKLNEILGGNGEGGTADIGIQIMEIPGNLKSDVSGGAPNSYHNDPTICEMLSKYINDCKGGYLKPLIIKYGPNLQYLGVFSQIYSAPTVGSATLYSLNADLRDARYKDIYAETNDTIYLHEEITFYINGNWSSNIFICTGYCIHTTMHKTISKQYIDNQLGTKQPLLTAGENITIDENNVISASGGSSGDTVPTIVWSGATDADAVAQIQKWVDYYNATGAFLPIYMSKGNDDTFTNKVQCLTTLGTYLRNSTSYVIGIYGISGLDSHFNKDIYVKLTTLSVRFTDKTRTTVSSIVIWGGADHRLALNYNGSSDASQNGCLAVTNVKEYTPTDDYNPATKKYVDDAITNAITSVLEAEY